MMGMHLIGAEHKVEDGYPYYMFTESWGATLCRRHGSKNVRKPRKYKGGGVRKDSNRLPTSVDYSNSLADMSGGASSLSSFASISTGSSSSNSSDNDSDNDRSSSASCSEQDNTLMTVNDIECR